MTVNKITLNPNSKEAIAQHLLQMAEYYLTQMSLPFHKRELKIRKTTLKKSYNENLEKLANNYKL